MVDPIQVLIMDVSATAEQLTVYLSRQLESGEITDWETRNNYELIRTRAGVEDDLVEDDISYDEMDPSRPVVVIHLVSQNVAGDTLHVRYIKPGEESSPFDIVFEEPSPEPVDMGWIKGKLETIDEGVDDIQARLPFLEDAAQVIKDEIPDNFHTSIGNIEEKVTNIDKFIQTAVEEIGKLQTAIAELEKKLEPVENIEAKLEPIVRIDGNVTGLAQAAQIVANEFPNYDGYVRAQFKTITDAVVVPPNTPHKQIESRLLSEQTYVQGLAESPDKQWKMDLVARQFTFWKTIVPFVKAANQTGSSKGMELLQADINVNLSDSAGKEQLIDILASPELKRDALKRINKALVLVNS